MGANNVFPEIKSFDKGLVFKNKAFKRIKQQSVGIEVFGSKAYLAHLSKWVCSRWACNREIRVWKVETAKLCGSNTAE